jgi:hypothetical protein
MDAAGERQQTAGPVGAPAWYAPLLDPAWLLPAARDGAPRVVLAAERWPDEPPLDQNALDLRLGLPLFLAEAIRYLTDAVPEVRAEPLGAPPAGPEPGTIVLSAVSPAGTPSVRVRVIDPVHGERAPVERPVSPETELGPVLASLPRDVVDALRAGGVGSSWDPRFTSPAPDVAPWIVRGHHACVRLADPATFSDPNGERRAVARDEARVVLRRLADAATSSDDVLPAVLFFATFEGATRAGMDAANDFRIAVNSRCMEATDPLDPIHRLSVLMLRRIGDENLAERRAQRSIAAVRDPAYLDWLERVRAS